MSKTSNKHNCEKCKQEYFDNEEDAYYCPPCLEAKKELAKQIDETNKHKPKRIIIESDYQRLMREGQISGEGYKIVIRQ